MPPLAGRAVGAPAALHAEAPQRRGAHLGHSRRALRRKRQWPAPLGVGLLRRLRAGDGDRFQPAAMSAVGASPRRGTGLSCCASSCCQRPGVSTLRASIPRAIRRGRLRRRSSRPRPFPWPMPGRLKSLVSDVRLDRRARRAVTPAAVAQALVNARWRSAVPVETHRDPPLQPASRSERDLGVDLQAVGRTTGSPIRLRTPPNSLPHLRRPQGRSKRSKRVAQFSLGTDRGPAACSFGRSSSWQTFK
jgi:hypothetical protein